MMNAPTNIATPAKISMKTLKNVDVLVHRLLVLGRQRGAGDDLHVGADDLLDVRDELRLRDAVRR